MFCSSAVSRAAGQASVFVQWDSGWARLHQLDTVFSSGCGGGSESRSHPNTSPCAFHQPLVHLPSPFHAVLASHPWGRAEETGASWVLILLMACMSPYKHHVWCDSSVEETQPSHSLRFILVIKKFFFCIENRNIEASSNVSTIQAEKQDWSLPVFLTLPDFPEQFL